MQYLAAKDVIGRQRSGFAQHGYAPVQAHTSPRGHKRQPSVSKRKVEPVVVFQQPKLAMAGSLEGIPRSVLPLSHLRRPSGKISRERSMNCQKRKRDPRWNHSTRTNASI